ncbi:type II toxin-antitoxin system HicA family toxin [Burkholderia ambifaria]
MRSGTRIALSSSPVTGIKVGDELNQRRAKRRPPWSWHGSAFVKPTRRVRSSNWMSKNVVPGATANAQLWHAARRGQRSTEHFSATPAFPATRRHPEAFLRGGDGLDGAAPRDGNPSSRPMLQRPSDQTQLGVSTHRVHKFSLHSSAVCIDYTLGQGKKGCVWRRLWRRIWCGVMDSRTVIRRLEQDGWVQKRVKGSHHHFRHPSKPGTVTVPHPEKDLTIATLKSIERQSGLTLTGQ